MEIVVGWIATLLLQLLLRLRVNFDLSQCSCLLSTELSSSPPSPLTLLLRY